MEKNQNRRSSCERRCVPAFLTGQHKGLETTPERTSRSQPRWKPDDRSRKIAKALEALPKLSSQLGFAMAMDPDAEIDVLPGAPTTITFTVGNELKGLMVLPIDEHEARHQLGLPMVQSPDLASEALYEELRELDMNQPDDYVAALWDQ